LQTEAMQQQDNSPLDGNEELQAREESDLDRVRLQENNNHVAIGKESYFSARQIRGRIWAPIETTEGSQTRANNRHGWMRLCATTRDKEVRRSNGLAILS